MWMIQKGKSHQIQMTTLVTGVDVKTNVGLSTSSIMAQKSHEAQKTEAEEHK